MDFSKSTKVVYERIHKLEPEYVSKIIGYLLLHGHGEHDMIRVAFSPDSVIQFLVDKAKSELGIPEIAAPAPADPYLQLSRLIPSPSPAAYSDLVVSEDYSLQSRMQFMTLEEQLESLMNPVGVEFGSNWYVPEPPLGLRRSRRSPSVAEFPVKVCHYFSKGYCKHGNNCRYFHVQPVAVAESGIDQFGNEEQIIVSPGPLEKLEMEIIELLKSRRGAPISIASLPMIYYEKYGRNLQADGYLTESQRHGKAGYSLTKLLARLKCIRLIDRPHGQHSVILAEDAPKYMEFSAVETGSRQIYLTFPAESSFTEQDVSNYFSKYGHVQDVRIPCQQKRMFGFVTFTYAETVKEILSKGNPHSVCGARVLVKPYREKPRLFERKSAEKSPLPMHYIHNFMDQGDLEQHCVPRVCDGARLMMRKHHLIEENEQHPDFVLASKPSSHLPYLGFSARKLGLSAEMKDDFSSSEQLSQFLDSLTDGSTGHDRSV
ncbi:zinc finger CCCH domain-containing protein 18 isoform X2 [Momordica charantia]|uniref:Zinc finger CCCH domain-containing protein 18 isoform X2 n=1 Tax=Momordica charantia TaxID=3673 RepID=A0A6J1CFC6_MOMCH|nr:zinc finger CCCH domain-containing protein 18 isoform X2 [Momordica charantia]